MRSMNNPQVINRNGRYFRVIRFLFAHIENEDPMTLRLLSPRVCY